MASPFPKPAAAHGSRWRRWIIAILLVVLAAEIVVIGRRWSQPVESGYRAAARAERRLGEGPRPPGSSRIDYARLDQRLKALMGRKDMVGLAVAVVEDGQLAFIKGYGLTEASVGERVGPNTVFRWASVSKGVAATALAELAADGRLSLDDPVARWSDSLKLPHGNERVVTLADLLSHRLGIVKNAYDDRLEGREDPRAIRRLLGGLEDYCPPATCFGYQNVAFDAAHEAIEKATGRSYEEAVQALLFRPLGMKTATTTLAGLEEARSWARPHAGRRTLAVEEAYYRVPAAGGVNSSIVDLGIWMRAQMGGAPGVLGPSVLWTLHVPRVTTPRRGQGDYDRIMSRQSYGLGFRQMTYDGHRLIGHRGAVAGYRSSLLFDPEARVGVAMLWNSQSLRPTGLPLEVLDMYYRRPARDWLQIERP